MFHRTGWVDARRGRQEGADTVTGPTEAGITPNTDVAEEFAEAVGVDPTQEEIDHYRRLEGADEQSTEPAAPPAG